MGAVTVLLEGNRRAGKSSILKQFEGLGQISVLSTVLINRRPLGNTHEKTLGNPPGRQHLAALGWLDRLPARKPRFDAFPFLWKAGDMKTTLELPDELMRRVKIRAAEKSQKLKDTFAELLENGFVATSPIPKKPLEMPPPLKLKGGFRPTTEEIEAAIAWGRD